MAHSDVTQHKASTDGVSLLADEVVYENVHPSWVKWTKQLVLATLAFVIIGGVGLAIDNMAFVSGGVIVAAILAGSAYLARTKSRYVVTNERVIERVGLAGKSTNEVRIDDIQSIKTDASISERLVGKGQVEVTSAAADESVTIEGVSDYEQIANTIRERQRERATA